MIDPTPDDSAETSPTSGSDAAAEWDAMSLEDLGAAYARAAAANDPETFAPPPTQREDEAAPQGSSAEMDDSGEDPTADDDTVHPEGIIEAALFVGHPENRPLSDSELASLMRGVTEEEIRPMVDALNRSYQSAGQALRIVDQDGGYRLTIAPAVEDVRRSFLGRVREARLSQAAVEVLSLVAYQPGISAQTVQDQRGKDSASLLGSLVRRRLLEIRRESPEDGGRKVPHYYTTERFLALFSLESLADLPQVDEGNYGQQA